MEAVEVKEAVEVMEAVEAMDTVEVMEAVEVFCQRSEPCLPVEQLYNGRAKRAHAREARSRRQASQVGAAPQALLPYCEF